MSKMKMSKMSGDEARAILVDLFIQALQNASDVREVIDVWDEDEAQDFVSALRVIASNSLANKVKKQLC